MKTGLYLYAISVCASCLIVQGGRVLGQDVERDTTITGPRGRTIQRHVDIQRGPGTIDRSVTIKRPGGTFERQTQIQRSPAMGRRPIPGPWPRPPWIGPRPLAIVQPAPAVGFGLVAAPFMNFSIGGGGGGWDSAVAAGWAAAVAAVAAGWAALAPAPVRRPHRLPTRWP